MAVEAPAKRKCVGVDCPNDAGALQCPTCLKMNKESFFCSQDCFKRSWVCWCSQKGQFPKADKVCKQGSHKVLHKSSSNPLRSLLAPKIVSKPDPATGHYNPFPTFPFTGPLRPVYPLSPKREVPASIPPPDYAKDGIPKSEQVFVGRNKISILDEKEIKGMRKVCKLAREVLDIAARAAKPGITSDYIDEVVHKACLERKVGYRRISGQKQDQANLMIVIPIPFELLPFP